MLARRAPVYRGDRPGHSGPALHGGARPLRTLRETIPDPIDQAVQKALARAPADRFATAAHLAQALAPSVTTPMATPTIVPPVAAHPQVPSRSRPCYRGAAPIPVGLATLVIGFVLGLGILFAWRRAHLGGEVTGPKHLAVLPFENLGDSADVLLRRWHDRRAAREARRRARAGSGGRAQLQRIQANDEKPARIAKDLGADYCWWARSGGRRARARAGSA